MLIAFFNYRIATDSAVLILSVPWYARVKKRYFITLVVVALCIVVTLSLFVYLTSQRPYSGEVEPVTIGVNPSEFNSLIYIAHDQHYFLTKGLNVTIRNYPSGSEAVSGLLNGEVDLSTASEFVIAKEATQNSSLYALGSVCKYLNLYVAARTDRDINSVMDLQGKTIGVTLGTAVQFYLGRFLELSGVNGSEVTLFDVPFAKAPYALANGAVDAVITFEPYLSQINALLANRLIVWPAQADQFGYYEAICTRAWAAEHPDLVVRFLKAIVQAENINISHQDQAQAIVAKNLNYTSSQIDSVWTDFQFSVTLDQSFILLMQDEARWLMSNNMTNSGLPNFLNYVYLDGMKAVKPGAVNIIV